MKKRKLSYALLNDKLIYINDIDNSSSNLFLCPNCNKEVIPKQGDKNVWHFSHKEKNCGYVGEKSNTKLDNFITKTISEIIVPSDPKYFSCVKCNKKTPKLLGVKWENNTFICKDCFRML